MKQPLTSVPSLDDQVQRLESAWSALNGDAKVARIAEIDKEMASAEFYNDRENADKVTRELKSLSHAVRDWQPLRSDLNNLVDMREMLAEEPDADLQEELERSIVDIADRLDKLEFTLSLNGPHDAADAYLSINSGSGGTEAADWAGMIMRMYQRFAEIKSWNVETLDLREGEEAGISSVALRISGEYAYGYLRDESGVHRLVRRSPFDSAGRRHTSFAAVDVTPVIEDDVTIEISKSDVREDTMRAQGAGGQHVNKTDSAIRLTHLPTGIVVQCQNERSQHKNRDQAYKMLKSKLIQLAEEERRKEREMHEQAKSDNSFGSQIRNYVLFPYNLVKDLRSNFETSDSQKVLDGELNDVIESVLQWRRHQGV